jgi:hypothetical protein
MSAQVLLSITNVYSLDAPHFPAEKMDKRLIVKPATEMGPPIPHQIFDVLKQLFAP